MMAFNTRSVSILAAMALGLGISACGGSANLASSKGGSAKNEKPQARPEQDAGDGEDQKADVPQQVSGAFLVGCELLTVPEGGKGGEAGCFAATAKERKLIARSEIKAQKVRVKYGDNVVEPKLGEGKDRYFVTFDVSAAYTKTGATVSVAAARLDQNGKAINAGTNFKDLKLEPAAKDSDVLGKLAAGQDTNGGDAGGDLEEEIQQTPAGPTHTYSVNGFHLGDESALGSCGDIDDKVGANVGRALIITFKIEEDTTNAVVSFNRLCKHGPDSSFETLLSKAHWRVENADTNAAVVAKTDLPLSSEGTDIIAGIFPTAKLTHSFSLTRGSYRLIVEHGQVQGAAVAGIPTGTYDDDLWVDTLRIDAQGLSKGAHAVQQ